MSELADLRRANPADLAAVIAHQRAAYARNRDIMGVEPLPLRADYAEIFRTHEVWLAERDGALEGVLILLARPDDLHIWSVATAPSVQRRGVGTCMLAAAEARARALDRPRIHLRTGEKLTNNVAWYQRHGFVIERVETLSDRNVVHMIKTLA